MMTDAEKAKLLKEAYKAFVGHMADLRHRRLDLAKKVVGRIEQKKIQEILDSLK